MALLVRRATLALRVLPVHKGPLARKGRLVRLVRKARQARRGIQAQPVRKARLVRPGRKATLALRGLSVRKVRQGRRVRKAKPEQRVFRVHRDLPERRATPALPVRKVPLVSHRRSTTTESITLQQPAIRVTVICSTTTGRKPLRHRFTSVTLTVTGSTWTSSSHW